MTVFTDVSLFQPIMPPKYHDLCADTLARSEWSFRDVIWYRSLACSADVVLPNQRRNFEWEGGPSLPDAGIINAAQD